VTESTFPTSFQALLDQYASIRDLDAASAALSWDQETMMPSGGQAARGQVLSTLAGLRHDKLSSTEFADALAAAEAESQAESVEAQAVLRESRKAHDRATCIPGELARELAQAESSGLAAWQAARKADDFSLFRNELATLVDLVKQKADALAQGRPRYDALLDLFEPGSTEQSLTPLFDGLRAELAPLVQAVADSGVSVDESPVQGHFPEAVQLEFGKKISAAIGFDYERGRLDLAAHPFCSGFHRDDVRLTWRYQEDDFRPALFGILHESGHGLYEQGLPEQLQRTPIGDAVGLGVHESQSRLWENLVGRSRAFWDWALPQFHAAFPEKAAVSVEQIFPALHTVRPSLIRVEADEATYNLHVAARYEVERQLFAEQLTVDELPEAWDQAYRELLGVSAPSAADGVLQDIHWAMGAFGYFPTYTLGNLIASQLFEAAEQAIPGLQNQFAQGEFAPLLGWLREHVHQYGSRDSAEELVLRATGKPLSSQAFLNGIRSTSADVYGV